MSTHEQDSALDPEEERRRKRREYEREYRSRPEVKARRKEIQKKAIKKFYEKPENRAKRAAHEKEYWARPENVERRAKMQKESKARAPEEVKARHAERVRRYYRENEAVREATKARAKANDEKLKAENPEEYHRRRREYTARHRAKFPEKTAEKQLEYNRRRIKENKEYVHWVKGQGSCADCKGTFHSCQMDFDHVNGEKTMAVAKMAGASYSLERIIEEIEKCILVCANCHRLRTWTRLQKEGITDMTIEEAS
jgi:hypothetical protein